MNPSSNADPLDELKAILDSEAARQLASTSPPPTIDTVLIPVLDKYKLSRKVTLSAAELQEMRAHVARSLHRMR